MERDTQHEQLVDLALGDLPATQRAELETRLEHDDALREDAEIIRRTVLLLRAVPGADAPDALVDRVMAAVRAGVTLEAAPVAAARVFELGPWLRHYTPRVAAVLVVSAAVVLGLSKMPEGPAPMVARLDTGSGTAWVHDGERVESGIEGRRVLRFRHGEALLDGATSLRLRRTGDFTAPVIEIERGRVVLTSGNAGLKALAGEQEVMLEPGATVAVDLERPYQQVSGEGERRMVEIQRQSIAAAAAIGEKTYGITIDVSGLPQEVLSRRVSFYGAGMSPQAYVASLVESASAFGVSEVSLNQRDTRLVYVGGTDRGEGLDDAVLRIAVLKGQAVVSRDGDTWSLSEGAPANSFRASTTYGIAPEQRSERALASMVVWAGGLGSTVVDARLQGVGRAGSLPRGSVIHSDRLVLRVEDVAAQERVFLLGGPEFTFPLPGNRKGRLVSLISTGAEFEYELDGDLKREFIPLSSFAR